MAAMPRSTRTTVSAFVLITGVVMSLAPVLIGGWLSTGEANAAQGSSDPAFEATATRQAELDELSELRTQVARYESTPGCPPDGTPDVASPVPPAQAGTALAYGDDWTVTITDLSTMPTFGTATAQGIFARVSLTAINNTNEPLRFPYDDLVLRDSIGRSYLPALEAKTQLGAHYFDELPPSLPTNGFVIFDVATDAEGPFILESTADPAFRVVIEVQLRG
jgi:hypothetical protein